MRFLVLFFGLIAIIVTGAASAGFFVFDAAFVIVKGLAADLGLALNESYADSVTGCSHTDTAVFLGIAAAYGLVGVMLSFLRCGWQGALMLTFPALAAALFNPVSLVFTGFQVLVGLLSFLVFPLPLETMPTKPAKRRSHDEDDDEDED